MTVGSTVKATNRIPFPRTDSGNAEMFASLNKDSLRFDHRRRRWLVWGGHWWFVDDIGEAQRRAKQATRTRLHHALNLSDSDLRMDEMKWALTSESRQRLEAMLALARSEKALADAGSDWNADPWLLGVENGVVDLRTGRLRPGDPAHRITIHTSVEFNPKAECPQWKKFINEIFDRDPELISFVQKSLGYSVSGDTTEQAIFLCFGAGGNGKTTMLEATRFALGGYARNVPFSTLEFKGRSAIPNDLASLVGKRFVTALETKESERLNEQRIKMLTGGDAVTARFLYGEFFEFHPVAKFWLAFNHKPLVTDDSHGFWRRIRLIPFLQEFSDRRDDKELINKLRKEAPGILNWLIDGCLKWQRDGLGMPRVVKEATEVYQTENDPIGEFIEECCVLDPDAEITAAALWESYQRWIRTNGMRWPLDQRACAERLQTRGIKKIRLGHKRTRGWKGLRLKDQSK